jgi:plasmid maintenance system antidote protein VapI
MIIKPVITGHELKVKLLMLNMSQIDLANALNVSIKTANALCNGKRLSVAYQLAIVGVEYNIRGNNE